MKQYAPKKANPQRLERFVSSAFQSVGVPPGDADLTARILVDADLRGIDSHGVLNLHGTYIRGIQAGTINPKPEIRMSWGSPTTASADGDRGLGFLVSYRAMTEELFVSLQTIKNHVSRIYKKTDARNRIEFVNLVRNSLRPAQGTRGSRGAL